MQSSSSIAAALNTSQPTHRVVLPPSPHTLLAAPGSRGVSGTTLWQRNKRTGYTRCCKASGLPCSQPPYS
ncbi:hypothetical protein DPEC_G00015010 [Dallia pectoralis]|uniref:Uncharacterized protein n=1 Tax=Dallia pectoralis TaxID=75939 RepID=A0ACC2HMA9_DALPE|nr:hypothetical protein DPEC_G00015010 [Dallia pectoralis]